MKIYLPLIYACSFLFSFSALAQKALDSEALKKLNGIDTVFQRILKDQEAAGFAVAIVKGNDVIYSKGFGFRDVAAQKPVTPNTLFAIGSSSKAFTTALLGILEKEEKLSFDDPATQLLPQLQFNNRQMNDQLLLKDLVTHRTGLSRYDASWYFFNTSNRDSLISRVKYMVPNAGIRERWQYNNFMYLAQGMIAERLTGKTWETLINEKFFIPLQMKRSNTTIALMKNDPDAALPYYNDAKGLLKKTDYYNIDGMGPAGSINSSVNDMANWLKLWIAGGKFQQQEILTSAYVNRASTAQMMINGSVSKSQPDVHLSGYGYGWMINSFRGHFKVEHGGNIDGFSASVAFFPTDGLGVVVLTNQNASSIPDIVCHTIADRMFGLSPVDWNGKAKKQRLDARAQAQKGGESQQPNIVQGTQPSHPLTAYTGGFDHPAFGKMRISLKEGKLLAQAGITEIHLRHRHYDVFETFTFAKDAPADTVKLPYTFNFFSNEEGRIEGVRVPIDVGGDPVIFAFKPDALSLKPEQLQKYLGNYALGGVDVKVYLKGEVLMVFVPGQPDYETVPTEKDRFDLKALKGYSLLFETNEQGKVISVSFVQPNGTFKAIKKE